MSKVVTPQEILNVISNYVQTALKRDINVPLYFLGAVMVLVVQIMRAATCQGCGNRGRFLELRRPFPTAIDWATRCRR